MSEIRYRPVPVQFLGRDKAVMCRSSPAASPLLALTNYVSLGAQLAGDNTKLPPYVEERRLIEPIQLSLEAAIPKLAHTARFSSLDLLSRKESLLHKVASLSKGIHLNPGSTRCPVFVQCNELIMFHLLDIKVVHGWLLDPKDEELCNAIGKLSKDSLLAMLSRGEDEALAASSSNPSSLRGRIRSFADSSLTSYGLDMLHTQVGEGQLAILCIKDQFDVVYKFNGDLFTLETDEHVLTTVKDAMWKKLTLKEEESFYVTKRFSPTKLQPNARKASEWWQRKLSELGDSGDIPSKEPAKEMKKKRKDKKSKAQRNLGNKIEEKQEVSKPATSEDDPTVSHVSPPRKGAPKPATIAERFLKFLAEYQDGGNVPIFEVTVAGMRNFGLFKLHVPFLFIEQYDIDLAIDIQDEYPNVQDELLQSAVCYLVNHGFNEKDAAEHAELQILNLPDPKSVQKFLQFVKDNEMVHPCELYDESWDNATTPTGRNMGLGYINHMFDMFESGKCWGKGRNEWDERHMLVRNKGKEFVINKEAEEEVNRELVVYNLLKLANKIFPCFEGKTVESVPAFFDSLQADFLAAPDPKGDRQIWDRYAKLMRSPLALKAPLVRSGLITNFYRVLSLQLVLNPLELEKLTKKLGDDWRLSARNLEPFLGVYKYKNDLSDQDLHDKWGSNHWDVVKYSRHFIEHVLMYLKRKSMLQDIAIVELMVARRLERHIANSIRTIVFEFGVEGVLSSAWGCFEASDCKTMPLQTFPQVNTVSKQGENIEENVISEEQLVVHVSTSKSGEQKTTWAYAEIGRTYSPSDELSSQESIHVVDLPLTGFKTVLEEKGFQVESSSDGLHRGEYIVVTKIVEPEQRSNRDAPEVAVQGPLSDDYRAILEYLDLWLSSPDSQ